MDRKRKRAEWKRIGKEWIERGRERSKREEQRMDRKRKSAEWTREAKNG